MNSVSYGPLDPVHTEWLLTVHVVSLALKCWIKSGTLHELTSSFRTVHLNVLFPVLPV